MPAAKYSRSTLLASSLALALSACTADVDDASGRQEPVIAESQAQLELARLPWHPSTLSPFAFESHVSTSGEFSDGDVRLDGIEYQGRKLSRLQLAPVIHARILVDDGVDEARGGHNLASGQGINSELDSWASEGPATITPDGRDLAQSLGNFNLTSIVVTRENVGTASVELTFPYPINTLFFWERGSASSPTTANSDILVETLDWLGRVTASRKLLRSEYTPTGIEISTWNGSFASPSAPGNAPPQLGSAGLALDGITQRIRLTSVQGPVGGVRDDGPDYKVIGALVAGPGAR
jgi:hypothetical protein